jgi:hypothetical protein
VIISKRVLAAASSLALVGSVAIGFSESGAGAAALPKHDAANDVATCNDIIGKIKFSVPLHLGGTTPNNITISAKSGDCIDVTAGLYDASLNPTGVTLKGYSGKGTLTSSTNDCIGLQGLGTQSGSLPGKYTTVTGTPGLLDATSTLNIAQSWGGTFNDGGVTSPSSDSDSWGGQYGFFAIGAAGSGNALGSGQSNTAQPSVTGAFTGGDSGHKSIFNTSTAQSAGDLGTQCFSAAGIKGITFGIGGFTTQ